MLQSTERIKYGNWWIETTDLGRWFREALLVEDAEFVPSSSHSCVVQLTDVSDETESMCGGERKR